MANLAPTAKVTAATAAVAFVQLLCALIEWTTGNPVPSGIESPASIIATFAAGYLAPAPSTSTGAHVAETP